MIVEKETHQVGQLPAGLFAVDLSGGLTHWQPFSISMIIRVPEPGSLPGSSRFLLITPITPSINPGQLTAALPTTPGISQFISQAESQEASQQGRG